MILRQVRLNLLNPLLMLFMATHVSVGQAQIVTNITPTTAPDLNLGTQTTTSGSTTSITGGTRPGNGTNLFHSFDAFSLGTGDIAHFQNNMALPTTNIIGRVTGGTISNIDGTLRTNNPLNPGDSLNFGAAHLWLMNPTGIVLGPNAVLDVGGAVTFTTADYLRFQNSTTLFDLASTSTSLGPLAVDPVTSFGFLNLTPPAPITVQGSILKLPEGRPLSLIGGNITVQSGTLGDGTTQAASLQAPGGQINLVSVASPGDVLLPNFLPAQNINGTSFSTIGTVSLSEGTVLDASGQLDGTGTPIGAGAGGTVFIRSGRLVMDTSIIKSTTIGPTDGADTAVELHVGQDVTLTNEAVISTQTFGRGRGGDVQITAGTLTLSNASGVITETQSGDGVGGNLRLNIGTLTIQAGPLGTANIRSANLNFGTDVDLDGVPDVFGLGGSVAIHGIQGQGSAADSVIMSGGSRIASETLVSGNGGPISITAQALTLGDTASINASTFGDGLGGTIDLAIQQLHITGGATVTSHTDSIGLGAAAGGTITVHGLAGEGSKADSVTLSGPNTGLISETFGTAKLGDITVRAKTISLTDGAVIQAGTPVDTGSAGTVTIEGDSVSISSRSFISSQAFSLPAGPVKITANQFTMDNGSIITNTSSELTDGRGGDVLIQAGSIRLTNRASINSTTNNIARAGDITFSATGPATVTNGSSITASSTGSGNAGNITMASGSTLFMENSSVTTEASQASGGQITVNAKEMIRLINSPLSTSVAGAAGDSNGGNISIDPDFVILKGSPILARAFAGSGGAIDVTSGLFLADPASVVDASSTLGVSGTVQINAPINNLSSVVGRLPESLLSVQALLRASCAAKLAQGATSSFVERGRDGIPTGPDSLLASPYLPMTVVHSGQPQAKPLAKTSGLQLRRLLGHEVPASVTLISDHTACSS